MDLTDTFDTNKAPDHPYGHSSSEFIHKVDVAKSKQLHDDQDQDTPEPQANKTTNNAHHFGRNVALGMACMDAAERLRDIKNAKSGTSKRS